MGNQQEKIIGYSIRLFKKTSSINNPINNDFFDFFTFGNFDGAKVYEIRTFNCFADKRVLGYFDEEQQSQHCAHCERQILNLLKLKKNVNAVRYPHIFSKDYSMPIIVILIMTSYEEINVINTEVMESILSQNENIDFEIFNVLSSEDRVIVFRSYSLHNVFAAINKFKKIDNDFVNFHSIPGVFKNQIDNWHEDKINASLRFHIRPNKYYIEFLKYLSNNEVFLANFNIQKDKFFQILGKYDAIADISLKDTKNFLKMFDDNNILNLYNNKFPGFISSNTAFAIEVNLPDEDDDVILDEINSDEIRHPWKEMVKRVSMIESEIVKRAATVLAERVHLLKHSVFSHKYFNIIYNFVTSYLDKLGEMDLTQNEHRQYTLNQITYVNLFIDNIYSYSLRDFEFPQKDIRIVIDAGKLLVSYTKFAQALLSQDTQVLIVPDINEKIENAYDLTHKILIARIPEDSIFDVNTNLFMIGHEVGHSYIGESKIAEALAIFIGYFLVYTGHTNHEQREQYLDKIYKYLKKNNIVLLDTAEKTIQSFYEKMCKLAEGFDKTQVIAINNLPKNINLSEDFKMFRCAYEETFADIFMIRILGIETFREYFLILSRCFNKSEAEVEKSFCIRLLAVFIYFNYDEYKLIYDKHSKNKTQQTKFMNSFKTDIQDYKSDMNVQLDKLLEAIDGQENRNWFDENGECFFQAEIIYKEIKNHEKIPKEEDKTYGKQFRIIFDYHENNKDNDKDCAKYIEALSDFLNIN